MAEPTKTTTTTPTGTPIKPPTTTPTRDGIVADGEDHNPVKEPEKSSTTTK